MRSRLILLAVLVLGASLLLVQVASAYGMHRGAGPGMMSMDKLTKALNLTPDQVSRIQAIHQSMRAQVQAILADKSLTPEARRDKLTELRKSTHEQVTAVLTPDQQAKFKQFAAERKAKWADRFSEALGLTPDQQAQIKAIKETAKTDILAVRSDTTLSADAKMAKIKDIRTAAREKFRAALTPEQRAKLDALRESHKRVKTY